MNPEDNELDKKTQERFDLLPKVVQDAITSADVEKRMRDLADTQKLHLDQWDALEKEVQLALLGFEPVEDLEKNIINEVKVSPEVSKTLTTEISKIVFEPIRQELERQLQHPEAKATQQSDIETMRSEAIKAETAPAVQPATPPAPPNEQTVERAPVSESYKPGQASTERKEVHDDPYREPPA